MKSNFLIITLLAVLILVGCAGDDSGTTDKSPFIGGTNGLLLKFMDNFPPAEIFDGGDDPFDIMLTIENAGEFDIPAGELIVTISGIQANSFGLTPGSLTKRLDVLLEGKKKTSEGDTIPGGEETIEFLNLNHVSPLTGTMTFPLRADVSYLYGTTASAKLCYKTNLRLTEDAVCTVEGSKTVYNSAGPVQITELEEYVKGSGAIGIRFKVSLQSNGDVCKHTLAECRNAAHADQNLVHVKVVTNEAGLTCRGLRDGSATEGYARLSEGEAVVQCDQPANVQNDFEKPVDIFLKYRYSEDMSTTLVVKHTPN